MRIAILAGPGLATELLVNYLIDQGHDNIAIFLEQPVKRSRLAKNRAKRLGGWTTFGQILFIGLINPLLARFSQVRKNQIISDHGLRPSALPQSMISQYQTINSQKAVDDLVEFEPDLVLVNGTRIIRNKMLEAVSGNICINTHVGITPQYRGVHGGYWALFENDHNNFGTTLHLLDSGVDTGEVVGQVRTQPQKSDNFSTYPILQLAIALPKLNALIGKVKNDDAIPKLPSTGESKQYYHPTIWQYFTGRLRGVK